MRRASSSFLPVSASEDASSPWFVFATNSSIEAQTQLLAVQRRLDEVDQEIVDFGEWISDRNAKVAERQIKVRREAKERWDPAIPVFEYAVQRLRTILVDYARKKNLPLDGEAKRVPAFAPSEGVDIGDFALGTNKLWRFHVHMGEFGGVSQMWVRSYCGQDSKEVANARIQAPFLGSVNAVIVASDGTQTEKAFGIGDFKKTVEAALKDLFAYHAATCPIE